MSKIEVNAIEPQCGTTLTVGASGDTITFPTGTTIINNGTQTGFGRTGTVDWDTTPKTATFTAVNGTGYFVNTTAGVITVNLPAGSAGNIVSLADYAATWQTYNVTVAPNGTDKIGSLNENAILNTEGQSVTFIYVDSTQGWINTMDSTSNVRGVPPFIVATGGTITTVCTDYKVHTFTGPGTFTVTNAGVPTGSDTVSYVVVAGGGGGGYYFGAAGGGGGFRESKASTDTYTASPLNATSGPTYNLPVSVQSYPIVIGAGGSSSAASSPPNVASNGSNSVFSTITSAGGGGGSGGNAPGGGNSGAAGGSGGGSGGSGGSGGAGNTPPVSPPQGNSGENSAGNRGGSGGGAIEAGGTDGTNAGGDGATTSINGTPTAFAGGGGGSNPGLPGGDGGGGAGPGTSGTANTGGGQGGCASTGGGGSGIVIIRYKFQ